MNPPPAAPGRDTFTPCSAPGREDIPLKQAEAWVRTVSSPARQDTPWKQARGVRKHRLQLPRGVTRQRRRPGARMLTVSSSPVARRHTSQGGPGRPEATSDGTKAPGRSDVTFSSVSSGKRTETWVPKRSDVAFLVFPRESARRGWRHGHTRPRCRTEGSGSTTYLRSPLRSLPRKRREGCTTAAAGG